jgi:hypothetical protein
MKSSTIAGRPSIGPFQILLPTWPWTLGGRSISEGELYAEAQKVKGPITHAMIRGERLVVGGAAILRWEPTPINIE